MRSNTQNDSLWVSTTQLTNPVLQYIQTNITYVHLQTLDFLCSSNVGLLLLSSRPCGAQKDGLSAMLKEKLISCRVVCHNIVVLCQVESEEETADIVNLNKTCISCGAMLFIVTSSREAAVYIDAIYESERHRRPFRVITEDIYSDITAIITGIRGLTRTDVKTICGNFTSFAHFCRTDARVLSNYPGIGMKKIRLVQKAAKEPF
mmetsp:Transcript_2934/g.10645  ORF Transcript_2934/g.10645 Transcript_2934/m.10645 type:complete len:205 (+) Transcript_2934:206-820(+)